MKLALGRNVCKEVLPRILPTSFLKKVDGPLWGEVNGFLIWGLIGRLVTANSLGLRIQEELNSIFEERER